MERKEFKIIKNMLIPVKSVIEIGPEGILNNKKFVKWNDIVSFSYGITSINRAMNYIVGYDDINGKGHMINFIVTIAGSKKKKVLFAEIYQMLHEGFTEYHIKPKSQKMYEDIQAGKEIVYKGATLSGKGIKGKKAMKKEEIFIAAEDIQLMHRDGSGGFDIASKQNPNKDRLFIQYQGNPDARYLLATLEKMYPEQAYVYK